jgi:hypothetical protein
VVNSTSYCFSCFRYLPRRLAIAKVGEHEKLSLYRPLFRFPVRLISVDLLDCFISQNLRGVTNHAFMPIVVEAFSSNDYVSRVSNKLD